MSRTPSTAPKEGTPDDTPPHGVPPVRRAAAVRRSGPEGPPAQGEPALDAPARDAPALDAATRAGRLRTAPPPPDRRADLDRATRAYRGAADLADGDGTSQGPVRVTRSHARRARPQGRLYEGGTLRHLRLTRRAKVLGAVLAVLVVLAGLLAWYEVASNPFGPAGKPVLVDVRAGEPLGAITAALERRGVISTGLAFQLWSVVHGSPVVRPGTYELHRNIPFSEAKSVLDAGPNVARITVVPGTTLAEVTNELASLPGDLAHAFSDQGRASEVRSPFEPSPGASLEGLIGSGTYRILPGESGRALLASMVARFDAEARAVGLTPSTSVDGLDAYQLVTLASIAQKEGYYTRYMGDVARVILNRLADGMNLDMTSTVLYSLGKDGGQVTPQEEQLTTPYNTYLHPGLTPTPICTPSPTALRAALHPPPGTWLYFDLVTAKKGVMKFASTYTQQVALIQEAAANAAKRTSAAAPGSGSTAPGS